MQWSLSYSQNTTNYTFFPRRKIQVQKWDAHTHTCTFTQTKWQVSEREQNRQREKRGGEREGSRRPCDGGWHRSSQCGQGTQLRLELEAQARLCVQVPSHCPAHFHPSSTPTLPQPPRLTSANRIARGWRHSGATSKARSGERLRAWCWHTTKSHTRERQRGSRDGQF